MDNSDRTNHEQLPAPGRPVNARCSGLHRRDEKYEAESKPTTNKKLRMDGYGHALFGLSGFHGGHEAGQAAPQRLHSTIFPFGLKAEFLAHQNRRPPPSFA
jgi:hypothetical protein